MPSAAGTSATHPPAHTYARALADRAERDPHGELLRVSGGDSWSAADLWHRSRTWAAALAGSVGPGAFVATRVPAGPEAVALTGAISAIGAVEVALPTYLPARAEQRLLERCVLLVDDPGQLPDTHPGAPRVRPAVVAVDAPALVMTTSGTTGQAKAALLPAEAPAAQARRIAAALAYGPGDTLVSCFAWHHVNARNATVLPAVLSGARVVFTPRFSASGFLDTVRTEGVTGFNFMGAMGLMLLAQPERPDDRDHPLRTGYGGPAPAWLVRRFADRFGVTLRQAYACTELGDVANTPVTALRPGSAGPVTDDHEVRIVDASGGEVPDGEVGELLVRPTRPGLAVLEYLDDADATADAWTDGWFRTRDRVRLDDGWLFVEGRLGDVIRRRGVNIDPTLVEDAVLDHPDVANAAAVAVPSDLTEDEVLVHVELRPGATWRPDRLWLHALERLPRGALPRHLNRLDRVPVNANHKVDRALLRRAGLPDDAWHAEDAAVHPTPDESTTRRNP